MKVGIAGNYGHANLGDEALLLGAIELARTDAGLPAGDLVILSDNSADTEARLAETGCEIRQLRRLYGGKVLRLPLVVKDMFGALRGLDWLVFGGGGLLNDSNRTAVPLFVILRVLAWLRGVRVAWWSVGIGPLESPMHKRLASWLLRTSSFVTVRDEDSARMAATMFSSSFKVTPDLAHAVPVARSGADKQPSLVALSVIPFRKKGLWFEHSEQDYRSYCTKIVEVVRGLLAANGNVRIRLFPVSLQQDSAAIEDICALGELAAEPRVDVSHSSSVQSLLGELGSATLVIATRLHSVVLASLAGVPSVTIAYQPKVTSYAMELPAELPCFSIRDFSSAEVVAAATGVLEKSAKISTILKSENEERRSRLRQAIASWKELT